MSKRVVVDTRFLVKSLRDAYKAALIPMAKKGVKVAVYFIAADLVNAYPTFNRWTFLKEIFGKETTIASS